MNLGSVAPQWALIALLVLLAAAAIEDAVRLKISNLVPIGVLLLAFAVIVIAGPSIELWRNIVVFAATLAVGTFLFAQGKFGGGDVKLFAATALWFDLGGSLRLLIAVTIAGGLLALLILGLRLIRWSESVRRRVVLLQPKGGIPYGVAIAAGAAFAILMAPSEQPRRPDPLSNWELPRVQ